MAAQQEWSIGDFATRKGRPCQILKIHFEMDPPSVTVRMLDTGDEVGTEFAKLTKTNDADVQRHSQPTSAFDQEPWQCFACTLINDDPNATKCSLCETPRQQQQSAFMTRPNDTSTAQPRPASPSPPSVRDRRMSVDDEQMEENEWDILDAPADELNVVSWNVWFREDLEIMKRVSAISEHIEGCNAHLVVLQEVTPMILELLQNASFYLRGGWETYGVEHALDRNRAYFVVILSRIPPSPRAREPEVIPFTTNMGRYCLAMDFLWKGEEITVATTHLESREGTTSKYSALRQKQIETCFKRLSAKNNVIFGGDLNWSDARMSGDGALTVPRGWQDVWLRLRGNESGATYDEQSNGMLLGLAQYRSDRMFVRGTSCRIRDVKLIGCEGIHGATYDKQVQTQNSFTSHTETRTLPVFPSSHYGLYARFGLTRATGPN